MKKFLLILFLSIFLISLTSAICYDYFYGTAKTRVCGEYLNGQITFRCEIGNGYFGILYISDSEISCDVNGCEGSPSSSPKTVTLNQPGQKWATCWTNNGDYWVYANMYFNYNYVNPCPDPNFPKYSPLTGTCWKNEWACTMDSHCSPNICSNHLCVAPIICTNGQEKCEGTILSTCYNNVWTNRGQVNEKCGYVTQVCTANQERCSETFLEICTNNAWVSQGQVNGKCDYTYCTPSCSCASNICIGQTCSNGCGGNCQGTKDCSSSGTVDDDLISLWNKVFFEKFRIKFTLTILLTLLSVFVFLFNIFS